MIASAIIPSFERADALRLTLDALVLQTTSPDNFEVIVVDDGSTDGSTSIARTFEGSLRFRLFRQAHRGAGAARNLGARHASGKLLIFLDADMIPAPCLVESYLAAFVEQPDAIQIGRMLALPGAYETLFDQLTGVERLHDLGAERRELSFYHLASGNFALGADTFRWLGGFDEALRMTEDTDLGYRAAQAGIPLNYCPCATGFHNHPKTFLQRQDQVRQSAYWTAQLIRKHPEIGDQLPIYRDVLPVTWGEDPLRLVARKMGRRVLATATATIGLNGIVARLERTGQRPALLRSLYWKTLSGCRASGIRSGMKAPQASLRERL